MESLEEPFRSSSPSPPEVETFSIDKLPTSIALNKEGEELGRIIENPTKAPLLEQELCEIIKFSQ
jgi:hypothetical protein